MSLIEFSCEARRAIKNLLAARISATAANKASYDSLTSVEGYSHYIGLRKSEQAILNLLRYKQLCRMLDIGVGGGRTTELFSKISKKYVGVDYSENMINACREKFKEWTNISFAVADARNLSIFDSDSFDFVLFSHGGLDAVEHDDRIRILHEVWRVAKRGAYFCFSTSNLDAMLQFCKVKLSRNPQIFLKMISKLLLVRLSNPEMWLYSRGRHTDLTHMMYNVGGDNWSLKTYCITAKAQIDQLKDQGFDNTAIYDMQGKEVQRLPNTTDFELYYLCNVIKPKKTASMQTRRAALAAN